MDVTLMTKGTLKHTQGYFQSSSSRDWGGQRDGCPSLESYREIHLIYKSEVQVQASHKALLIHTVFDTYFSIW